MKTDLSIIIVSYKGWDRLTKCLESLEKFTGNNFTAQVVVVDNKSEDETIREFEARFSNIQIYIQYCQRRFCVMDAIWEPGTLPVNICYS